MIDPHLSAIPPAPHVPLASRDATARRTGPAALVALALVAAAASIVFAAFFVLVGGRWGANAPPMVYTAQSMTLSRGQGQLAGEHWVVAAPDASGRAIVALALPAIPASDYPSLAWSLGGGEGASLDLLWRNDREPGRLFSRRLDWIEDAARVSLAGDPGWQGRVSGVALVVQGLGGAPLRVGTITLEPMSFGYVLARMAGEWWAPERWVTRSINYLHGGTASPLVRLPLFAAISVALAAAAYLALAALRRVPPRPIVLALLLALGWLAVDARWLADSTARARQTVSAFHGKSDSERLLAADDAALYAFVSRVKPILEKEPGRLFLFSDIAYARGRAAYHLLPLNVYRDIRAAQPLRAEKFRRGDVLILLQQRGVAYNPAVRKLRWVDGAELDAEPLAVAGGSAVFRLR